MLEDFFLMSPFFGMIQGTNFTIFLIVFLEAMFFFSQMFFKKKPSFMGLERCGCWKSVGTNSSGAAPFQ